MSVETRPSAIVTGASRGIGAATARALAAGGYNIAVGFAKDADAAEQVVEDLHRMGVKALAIRCDVAIEADVLNLFATAENALGPIHALVNNAGITGGFSRVDAVDATMLARLFAVNITGTILCSREAVKRMSTRNGGNGGAIVNISSRASHTGGAGEWVHYAASKGAVDTFTIGLARETAGEGIRVNAVAPGLIQTEIHSTSGDAGRLDRMKHSIPMQRPGTAEEVANGVVWLLSPAASFVTGTILEISGGR